MRSNFKNKFAILAYHRIAPMTSPPTLAGHIEAGIVTSLHEFDNHICTLVRHANVLHLNDAIKLAKKSELPPRSVVLTFDDGFQEHFYYVYSKLRKFKLPATMFITGHSLDDSIGLRWLEWFYLIQSLIISDREREYWSIDQVLKQSLKNMGYVERTEKLESLSKALSLSNKKLVASQPNLFADRQLILSALKSKYIKLGWHTMTHPCLSKLDLEELNREILVGYKLLKKITPYKVHAFAYPFGGSDSFNNECTNLVEAAGFSCACTSISGYNTSDTSRFELHRFDMCKYLLKEVLQGLI